MAKTEPQRKSPEAPQVKGGLVPYLEVDGAVRAAEFYQKAFGATLVALHPVDEHGRTMHVHLYINGSSLMLSDAFSRAWLPAQGCTGLQSDAGGR